MTTPATTTSAVSLRVYDLSRGMARQLSPALLGKQIDGIWHTGVLVYGQYVLVVSSLASCLLSMMHQQTLTSSLLARTFASFP